MVVVEGLLLEVSVVSLLIPETEDLRHIKVLLEVLGEQEMLEVMANL
jgi:hypothetical protein